MSQELAKYESTSIDQVWSNPVEIRKLFAPKLTDPEFQYFMGLSKATGANPFLREIWAVKYRDTDPAQIFHGRDFYRRRAEELETYQGHSKGAVYENDEFMVENGIPHHKFSLTNRGKLIGAYCVVYVKNRVVPFLEFVELREYTTGKSTWASKPSTMIVKVAEAQALRGAFQGVFGGTYDESEAWEVTPQQTNRQAEPQQETQQQRTTYSDGAFNKAYSKINTITDELDYHPAHFQKSIEKHLGVSDLSECRNMEKLKEYFQHLQQTQLSSWLEAIEKTNNVDIISKFVDAADNGNIEECRKLWKEATNDKG